MQTPANLMSSVNMAFLSKMYPKVHNINDLLCDFEV